jgi:hypothetical protein
LAYTQTLSYNSSLTVGDNQPLSTGIPYGEGWSLDIPSISVRVEDWKKYWDMQRNQLGFVNCGHSNYSTDYPEHKTGVGRAPYFTEHWLRSEPDDLYDRYKNDVAVKNDERDWFKYHGASGDDAGNLPDEKYMDREEGELYWFAPSISIPGVISGRLVYKYSEAGTAGSINHFALHAFERYVEVVMVDGSWDATLDDGTVYSFSVPAVGTVRLGANQRTGTFRRDQDTNCPALEEKQEVLGKGVQSEVTTWYVATIQRPEKADAIGFFYKAFGKNSVAQEQAILNRGTMQSLLYAGHGYRTDPSVAYSDVFLVQIIAGTDIPYGLTAKLDLEYSNMLPSELPNMNTTNLLVYHSQAHFADSLYSYKVLFNSGNPAFASSVSSPITSSLSSWYSYRHARHPSNTFAPQCGSPGIPMPNNPYKGTGCAGYPSTTVYSKVAAEPSLSGQGGLKFNHSYLESSPLSIDALIPTVFLSCFGKG